MPDQKLTAIITVLDQASLPLRRLQERVDSFQHKLARLGQVSGLSGLGAAVGQLGGNLGRAAGQAGRLLAPVAALAGLAGGAGIADMVAKTAEMGAKLQEGAVKTGIAAKALGGYYFAARKAHVETEQFDKAMEFLNKNLSNAAAGKNKDVAEIMDRTFGAGKWHDASGKIMERGRLLRGLAEQVKHLNDVGRTDTLDNMLKTLMGRGGDELGPMFAEGAKGLNEAQDAVKRHGLVPADGGQSALALVHGFTDLKGAIEGVSVALGDRLFPKLTPLIDKLTHWIDANRQLIATKLSDFILKVAEALGRTDWAAIGSGIEGIVTALDRLFKALGGGDDIKGAVRSVEIGMGLWAAAVMAPLGLVLWKIGEVMARLALAGRAAEALGAAKLAVSGLPELPAVATGGPATALKAAAPIGIVSAVAVPLALGVAAAAIEAIGRKVEDTALKNRRDLAPAADYSGVTLDTMGLAPAMPNYDLTRPAPAASDKGLGLAVRGLGPVAQLYGPAAAAPKPEPGLVKVIMDFLNVPTGTKTKIETGGSTSRADVDMNVGYAMPF